MRRTPRAAGAPAEDPARRLAHRREVLLVRSARLRDELVDDSRAVGRQVGLADRAVALARSPYAMPLLVAGGVLLLTVGRRGGFIRLAGRTLALWPVIRPFVPALASFVREARAARRASRPRDSG